MFGEFNHAQIQCLEPAPDVHRENQASERCPALEIGFEQLLPIALDGDRYTRISIARQVYESLPGAKLEEIDQLCTPRRLADSGELARTD